MSLTMRQYQTEGDYWKFRDFLRRIFIQNNYEERSWHVGRLDYWRWHVVKNGEALPNIKDYIFIWETSDGEIAAVLNPESHREAFLQIDPLHKTNALIYEMLSVAEARLSVPGSNGKQFLCVWTNRMNEIQKEILQERGYTKFEGGEASEQLHKRVLDASIPKGKLASGYIVRSLGDIDEVPGRSWASWRAFHPEDPDDEYEGWEWYLDLQNIPFYRRDLDIVAVAPDGEIAAFCTVWYDDVTRCGYIEPVGTVPEYHRKGLATAVLLEGMRQLKRLGGTHAFVGGYSKAANALYEKVTGSPYDILEPWIHRDL